MLQSTIYKYTRNICILIISIQMMGCSVTFEKRRYRPGYHVDIVQNHHDIRNSHSNMEMVQKVAPTLGLLFQDEEMNTDILLKKIPPVSGSSELLLHDELNYSLPESFHQTTKRIYPALKASRLLGIKHSQSLESKKLAAWILGGIAMVVALCSIAGFFVGYGVGAFIGLSILGIAAIIAIIALIIRFTKPNPNKPVQIKKPKKGEEGYIAIKPGFIKMTFIFSLITIALAAIGFLFTFLIYPMGLIGMGICSPMLIAGLMSIGFGFKSFKDDKGAKIILAIIFGFIAFLLTCAAIVVFLL